MTANAKAKLSESAAVFVEFDFNPKDLRISWPSSFGSTPDLPDKISASYQQQNITNWGGVDLHLGTVQFRGTSTWSKLMQLRTWFEPDPNSRSSPGSTVTWTRRKLTFSWGADGVTTDVELSNLTVNLTRFTARGAPVAATATIGLHVLSPTITATNPTSGGLPGRHTTTVVQGENLQAIALNSYGSPAHWRDVARLNGIEDPLRVRPGAVVYLPNRDELRSGGVA
jgi:hypothetical protein